MSLSKYCINSQYITIGKSTELELRQWGKVSVKEVNVKKIFLQVNICVKQEMR